MTDSGKKAEHAHGNESPKFKGYNLEQLRYQRALVLLQREFAKDKIEEDLERLRKRGPFGWKPGSSALVKSGSVASKVLSGFNYMDYALIGFSAFGTIRKAFRLFKRKK